MASKHYHIKFNFDHDKKIIDRIESQENKNNYIRSLILSDIAADILRASIKLEYDPDENRIRNEWYDEHCPGINDPNYECSGCYYWRAGTDDIGGNIPGYCDAETYFIDYLEDMKNGKMDQR